MTPKSVGELNAYIKRLIDGERILTNIAVKGELSNFKRYSSGHCYYTLKDETAALKCVMFKNRADTLKFVPQNGMAVVAYGRISVYERDGVYQLYTDAMQPDGIGALALAFEQLKNRLAAEGLFDERRKKPLPFYPSTIGVVTSISGAVLRDIRRVARRRNPAVALRLFPVAVQGEGSAAQIEHAIRFFNRPENAVDVLIVGRGGGSMEDLWSFNEERVVRAIAASAIPVVSAVGHETDFTLADFAADVRAATPSQAAELIVPDAEELRRRVTSLSLRLRDLTRRVLAAHSARLDACFNSTALKYPRNLLAAPTERFDRTLRRLTEVAAKELNEKEHRFSLTLNKLEALNPVRVMRRGFAAVKSDGRVLTSAATIKTDDVLDVTFADGTVTTRVTGRK